jgi:hypothetical protein
MVSPKKLLFLTNYHISLSMIINDLFEEIIRISVHNIPADDWESASLNIQALNKMIAVQAFFEQQGVFSSFDPEKNGTNITMLIKKLREEMYKTSPGQGAWYTASITVANDGKFQTHFDYNDKPEFPYEPAKEKYIDDLKAFPRETAQIPAWLQDIISA